ncbi:MAG: type II/IV secretion system protein [Spirochaetaceae bacterium]|nr:type II/IV secretion system protein [Spirochaetaceae bacterium]
MNDCIQYVSLNNFPHINSLENQYSQEYISSNEVLLLEETSVSVTIALTENTDSQIKNYLIKFHHPKKIYFVYIQKTELISYLAGNTNPTVLDDTNTNIQYSDFTLDSIQPDAPVVNIINAIIIEAIRYKVSDIHIEINNFEIHIRYRIDGILQTVKKLPIDLFNVLSSRIKIMAKLNIMEQRLPQDGRISVTIENSPIDIRVSIIPVTNGESITLRLFNYENKILSLVDLGLSNECINILTKSISYPHGLILVTGPTGSGKTTTLHSLLNLLPKENLKIITLEDPVEQIIQDIPQVQINETIGLTFEAMLRRVLRHDPNVIMVGEIRDSATAELAIRAALTGHLILTTLHTNDSVSAITRLYDMGIEPYLLCGVLRCIEAQRLVRKLCTKCSLARELTDEEKNIFNKYSIKIKTIKKAVGCKNCYNTGYKGRIAISEFFEFNSKLEDLIISKKRSSELVEFLKKEGMQTLVCDGLKKVANGITSLEELRREVIF